MSNPTPAQEEFDRLVSNNSAEDASVRNLHPEDRNGFAAHEGRDQQSEEDAYRASKISAAMRMPAFSSAAATSAAPLHLPPASFDSGRATGVKGVIADARSYETAKKTRWLSKVRTARRSIFGLDAAAAAAVAAATPPPPSVSAATTATATGADGSETDETEGAHDDEESFLAHWRESRRRELESEAVRATTVRNRRTSPSMRVFGRIEDVDALGYLDAIEKVGRETVVVVFVHDPECVVSSTVENALMPLVTQFPTTRFVKVHCDEIEFDNAAVPAILAYRNQGDLFANLTGVIDLLPEDQDFDSDSLRSLLGKHNVL